MYFQYSDAIDEFRRALSDQAVNACCSCERLLRKKSVTEAKNLDSDVWNNLLNYIRQTNPVTLNKCSIYPMFYLPLPLEKTIETLNEVGINSNHLPDPELYIIINGQPTKSNNVWRSLVDVNKIKAALQVLKEINWPYRSVDDDSNDESSKNVIQVVSNTTCKMLEKANVQDLESLSAYTIRNLDSKIVTGSDISQYILIKCERSTYRH